MLCSMRCYNQNVDRDRTMMNGINEFHNIVLNIVTDEIVVTPTTFQH